MLELTNTRSNLMIDPVMHIWGWEIPVYLFLGGLVAGMMIISGYFLLSGRHSNTRCACFILPGLSIVLLSLGMLALFLDLEHKLSFLETVHHVPDQVPDVMGLVDSAAGLCRARSRLCSTAAATVCETLPRSQDGIGKPDGSPVRG